MSIRVGYLIAGSVILMIVTSFLISFFLAEDKSDEELAKDKIINVVENLQYFRDPRTQLCFAYYWGGATNGGPALATVPCESIPRNLLFIAE